MIPARGGSVGVKGKNIRKLRGKPLILYTLEFALAEGWFDEVLITTDDSQIAIEASGGVIAKEEFEAGAEDAIWKVSNRLFIHKRKPEHCQTLSPIRDFLFEFVENEFFKGRFELLMMLQPTSPFRRHHEILEIRSLISHFSEFTSLVSVTPVGGLHPDRMYRMNEDYLESYIDQANQDNKPRQLLEKLFIKDGAYYLFRPEILSDKVLLGQRPIALLREGLCTINIDDERDFLIAELIVNPYTD
jgi:CMP-N,N'-diacetyllegionaminic acid synthase